MTLRRDGSVTELARRTGSSVQAAIRKVDRGEAARLAAARLAATWRIGSTRLVRADTSRRLSRPFSKIVLVTCEPPAVVAGEHGDRRD